MINLILSRLLIFFFVSVFDFDMTMLLCVDNFPFSFGPMLSGTLSLLHLGPLGLVVSKLVYLARPTMLEFKLIIFPLRLNISYS